MSKIIPCRCGAGDFVRLKSAFLAFFAGLVVLVVLTVFVVLVVHAVLCLVVRVVFGRFLCAVVRVAFVSAAILVRIVFLILVVLHVSPLLPGVVTVCHSARERVSDAFLIYLE